MLTIFSFSISFPQYSLAAEKFAQMPAVNHYPGTAEAVLQTYLELDAKGYGLTSETWPEFAKHTTWPDAPGWDALTIIKSFHILSKINTSNKNVQKFKVIYEIEGICDGGIFHPNTQNEIQVYEIVKVQGQWKINTPQLQPHVYAKIIKCRRGLYDGWDIKSNTRYS